MAGKKMGRPTDQAKPIRIGFRIDSESLKQLDDYCEKNKIQRSDLIRKAVFQFISK